MSKSNKNLKAEIGTIFSERWSPRSFDPTKVISEKDKKSIFEAARWTPSCFNEQPWRFIVCDRNTNKDAFDKALDCINEWNQGWSKNSQILAIVCHDTEFEKNGKENKWGAYDTGAATISAVYQAMELGIHSHQMGGFDVDKTTENFNIPSRYIPISVTAFGYVDSAEKLDERYKSSELAENERKDPSSLFFDGVWEEGLY